MNNIDKRLLAYKPISVTLNFDWDNTTYDERVQMQHDYIEEQKKLDPNYVGFDFIEYFISEFGPGSKNNQLGNLISKTSLISTLGQIIRSRQSQNGTETTFGTTDKNYQHGHVTFTNKESRKCRIHRLVACTFIPIPEELKDQRSYLVINHKNDIKHCNLKSNLEWCTSVTNTIKAIETGMRKVGSYVATWEIMDEHHGKNFYFKDLKEIRSYIKYGNIHQSIYGKLKVLYGCSWKFVNKAALIGKQTGFPKEIFNLIQDPSYINTRTIPIIGTVIKPGKFNGLNFVILGNNEAKKNGFEPTNIRSVLFGKRKKHKNCLWRTGTLIESKKYQRGLTVEQKDYLSR